MFRWSALSDSRRWLWSWICSGACHGLLLTGLVAQAVWMWWAPLNPAAMPVANQVELQAREAAEEASAAEAPGLLAELHDPDLQSVLGPIDLESPRVELERIEAEAKRHPADLLAERVRAKVFSATAEAERVSEDENRRRLENLTTGALNRVSSEETIDEMAVKFQQWLGTKKRAERPAAGKVAGKLDTATAEIDEVKRAKSEDGEFVYTVVLVDAEGRAEEFPLDAAAGESAYRTMQLLKANPLAELVYRRILMSLIDKVLNEQPAAP